MSQSPTETKREQGNEDGEGSDRTLVHMEPQALEGCAILRSIFTSAVVQDVKVRVGQLSQFDLTTVPNTLE